MEAAVRTSEMSCAVFKAVHSTLQSRTVETRNFTATVFCSASSIPDTGALAKLRFMNVGTVSQGGCRIPAATVALRSNLHENNTKSAGTFTCLKLRTTICQTQSRVLSMFARSFHTPCVCAPISNDGHAANGLQWVVDL